MRPLRPIIVCFLFGLMLLQPLWLAAGDNYSEENIKSKLPKLYGANNVGKEFWVTIPPCYEKPDDYIRVYVTSPSETLVNIDIPGKGYHAQKMSIPDDVIEFKITPTIGQCYERTSSDPAVAEKVYSGYGINIYADQPIVVYVVVRYDATSDGYLAIPVSSLGREYIIASYGDMGAMYSGRYPSETGIVAAYDKTKVTFELGGNNLTRTAGGMKPGEIATKTLNEGDVWMFSSGTNEGDLTGSKITSTKPVAVVSGNYCTNIPITNKWCDYTVEMDLPVYTWGLNYHVGKVPGRKRAPLLRVFAKEPNTQVFRDNKAIGYIQQSGGLIGKGYLEIRLVPFEATPRSAVISGDKPIGVTLYNCGVEEDGDPMPNSDPFVMAQTPMEQYQKEITFCTPGIYGGKGFPENYVNLVYPADEHGSMPMDVEFAKVVGGEFVWQPVKILFSGNDELFQYDVNGKKYGMRTLQLDKDGVYKLRANQPFAAYSFGYSHCDSYGFPTSAALMDVSRPDTLAPEITMEIDCDGTIEGFVNDMPDNDSIRVNLSQWVFIEEDSDNYIMEVEEFEAGNDRSTTFELIVKDKTKDAWARFVFSDRNGNTVDTTIVYKAVKIDLYQSRDYSAEDGTFETGAISTKEFWAVNRSLESDVTITRLWLKSDDPDMEFDDQGFKIMNLTLPFTIPPNDSVKFNIQFTAGEKGYYMDSVGIGDTCIFQYLIQVSAVVGKPRIYVEDCHFEPLRINKTNIKQYKVKNTSDDVELIITGYNWGDTKIPEFELYDMPEISADNPLIIPIGGEKIYQVKFAPTQPDEEYEAKVFFVSNAGPDNDDHICEITGSSIMPDIAPQGYDWGRLTVLRDGYTPSDQPVMDRPYRCDTAIIIENTGTLDYVLQGYEFDNPGLVGDVFDFDPKLISGKLAKGERITIPVTFRPKLPAQDYSLNIKISTDADISTSLYLKGTGIVPKLEITPEIDFGSTLQFDNSNPQDRDFVVKNIKYEYQDILKIEDFIINNKDISRAFNAPGDLGFSFDDNTPLTLNPGDSIVIPARFIAQVDGDVSTIISTKSNALQEASSRWFGNGKTEKISSTNVDLECCKYHSDAATVRVSNDGTSPIENIRPYFDPPVSEIRLADPSIMINGFSLAKDEYRDIEVIFEPVQAGYVSTKLKYDVNDAITEVDAPSEISGNAVEYSGSLELRKTTEEDQELEIGSKYNFEINYNPGPDEIEFASLQSIKFDLYYANDFIHIQTLELNSDYDDLIVMSQIIDQKAGKIHIEIQTKNDISIKAGFYPLCTANFEVVLPQERESSALISIPDEDIIFDEQCYEITGSKISYKLKNICIEKLMHFDDLFGTYHLDRVAPNPVSSDGADVKFGIGFSSWTKIGIYNEEGSLITMAVSDYLEAGDYSFRLPVEDIPSGIYIIRMESAHVTKTQRLVISK